MPRVHVSFYREEGTVPVLAWLDQLPRKTVVKCRAQIERLRELGHELRRPAAEYLGDGIYELRVRLGTVNYRILYFFHGRESSILAHGLTKEQAVPPKDIDLAVRRRARFESDPAAHRYTEEDQNGQEEA